MYRVVKNSTQYPLEIKLDQRGQQVGVYKSPVISHLSYHLSAGVYKMPPTVSGMFQEAPNRPRGTNCPRGTQMIVVS